MSIIDPHILPTIQSSFKQVASPTLQKRACAFVDFIVNQLPEHISVDPDIIIAVKNRIYHAWEMDNGYQKYSPRLFAPFEPMRTGFSTREEDHWMERLNISLFNVATDLFRQQDESLGDFISHAFARDQITSFPTDRDQRIELSPASQAKIHHSQVMPSA